jgi:hypothetical protein
MTVASSAQHLIFVYIVYILASVGLTVWLSRMLFKSGGVFLEDVFDDNPRLAGAVNRLLVAGFYLLNLGYALLSLRIGRSELTFVEAIEELSMKLGALMLALGAVHFGNLYLFHRMRRRGQIRLAPPPVRPQLFRTEAHANHAPHA